MLYTNKTDRMQLGNKSSLFYTQTFNDNTLQSFIRCCKNCEVLLKVMILSQSHTGPCLLKDSDSSLHTENCAKARSNIFATDTTKT